MYLQVDKASILGYVVKYLKQLEKQVKLLDEQTTKRIMESMVIATSTQDSNIDNENYSMDNENFNDSNPLLDIEA